MKYAVKKMVNYLVQYSANFPEQFYDCSFFNLIQSPYVFYTFFIKIFFYIFTFAFAIYFLLFASFVLSGLANVLTFSTTKFLSPYLIIIITIFLVYLSINQGLTNVGRISEFLFPLTIFILLIPMYFINKGSITNLLPIISDYKSIFKAIPDTLFSYSGAEISLLIIPFITDRKKIKQFSAAGSLITIITYTLTILLIINFCGWKLTSKLQYPFLYLVAGADVPVLSNFEPIFIFFWGNKIFQTISIGGFGASYTMSNLLKISYNNCCLIFGIITAIISCFFIPEYNRSEAINKILPYMIIFVLIWATLTLFLSYIKRGAAK